MSNKNDIHQAACEGDISLIDSLVSQGVGINMRDSNGCTPLHHASYCCHFDLVKYLVRKGAFKNTKDSKGYTPLLYAICAGNMDICTFLVGENAFLFVADNQGFSPLHLAKYHGHSHILSWLLSLPEVDKGITSKSGLTYDQVVSEKDEIIIEVQPKGLPFPYTINLNDQLVHGNLNLQPNESWEAVLQKIMSDLPPPSRLDGYTPLGKECMVLLDSDGEEASAKIRDGAALWKYYSKYFHAELGMTFDLRLGVDVSTVQAQMTTVHDDRQGAAQARGGGKDVGKPERENSEKSKEAADLTPVTAASPPPPDILNAGAVQAGVEGGGHCWDDRLATACIEDDLEAAKRCIASGASLSHCHADGMQPVHLASGRGHLRLVQLLLGVDRSCRNARDAKGRTPLMLAAHGGHLAVVQYLVSEKAFTFVVDCDGHNALQLASMQTHVHVSSWLVLVAQGLLVSSDVRPGDKSKPSAGIPAPSTALEPMDISTAETEKKVTLYRSPAVTHLVETPVSPPPTNPPAVTYPVEVHVPPPSTNPPTVTHPVETHVPPPSTYLPAPAVKTKSIINSVKSQLFLTYCSSGSFGNAADLLPPLDADTAPEVDVNRCQTSTGRTPLHFAILHQNEEFANSLIDAGANMNAKDFEGFTALHFACSGGMVSLISRMIQCGAKLLADRSGMTPLHHACLSGDDEVTKMLITLGGGEVRDVDHKGNSSLHYACEMNHERLAGWLVAVGKGDVFLKNLEGFSPYDIVRQAGYVDFATQLLVMDEGVRAATKSTLYSQSVLHLLSTKSWSEAETLLSSESPEVLDKAVCDDSGLFPIHICARFGRVELMESLIGRHRIDVNMRDQSAQRLTPLHHACENDEVDAVIFLLEMGAAVNVVDDAGRTEIFHLFKSKNFAALSYLLDFNANLEHVCCSDGNTIVHEAVALGAVDWLEVIRSIDSKYDIFFDAWNHAGEMPLDIARSKNCAHIVDYAYEAESRKVGACVTRILDAMESGESDCAFQYLRYELEVSPTSHHIQEMFRSACKHGYANIVKVLMERGASISSCDVRGWSGLHHACARGHLEVVKWLKKCGCDLNQRTSDGSSALHLACATGNLPLVAWLLDRGSKAEHISADQSNILHFCCMSSSIDLFQWICNEFNFSLLHCKNASGKYPIDLAVACGNVSMVEFLCATLQCTKGETISKLSVAQNNYEVKTKNDIFQHLKKACKESRLAEIRELLGEPFAPNMAHVEESSGNTLLLFACSLDCCSVDVVAFLVEQGASVHARNLRGETPTFLCCLHGNLPVFEYLSRNGANLEDRNVFGSSILLAATMSKNESLVKSILLLYPYLSESSTNNDGLSPIVAAAESKQLKLVLWFAQNPQVKRLRDILVDACATRGVAEVERIVSGGAIVDVEALHAACWRGEVVMVKYLLNFLDGRHAYSSNNQTVMHIAAHVGSVELLKCLHENIWQVNADFTNIKDGISGMTALHMACHQGNTLAAAFLIGHGASLGVSSSDGSTTLHFAIMSGDLGLVQWLVEGFDCDPNIPNHAGVDGVMLSNHLGHRSICRFLESHVIHRNTIRQRDEYFRAQELSCMLTEDKLASQRREQEYAERICEEQIKQLEAMSEARRKDDIRDQAAKAMLAIMEASFLEAILCGDIDGVTELLDYGIDATKAVNIENRTALHVVANGGHVDLVSILMQSSADVNAKDVYGNTPLMLACAAMHSATALSLLEHGADITLANLANDSALQIACRRGDWRVLQKYFSKTAPPIVETECMELLLCAVQSGNEDILLLLLGLESFLTERTCRSIVHRVFRLGFLQSAKIIQSKYPETLKYRDSELGSVLRAAVDGGHVAMVDLLVESGHSIYELDDNGDSPLHVACRGGHGELAALLINLGANLGAVNASGHTALQEASLSPLGNNNPCCAVISAFTDRSTKLLEICRSNNVAAFDEFQSAFGISQASLGSAPLHCASQFGSLDVCVKLLGMRFSANVIDSFGRTPLHLASLGGHIHVAKALLGHGADPLVNSPEGYMFLHFAAMSGAMDFLKWAVNCGYDVNMVGSNGWSPMLCAAYYGHTECVQWFLSSETVNTSACLQNGSNVLHCAILGKRISTVQMIASQFPQLVDQVNTAGNTPFLLACLNNDIDIAKFLFLAGCNFRARSLEQDDALHICCRLGHESLALWLFKVGFSHSGRNSQGQSAVEICLSFGAEDVAKTMIDLSSKKGFTRSRMETLLDQLTTAVNYTRDALANMLLDDIVATSAAESIELHLSVIFLASMLGRCDVLEHFDVADLAQCVEPDSRRTCLHLAVMKDRIDVVSFLLERGVRADAIDAEGLTAVDVAKKYFNKDILSLFRCVIDDDHSPSMPSAVDVDDDEKVEEHVLLPPHQYNVGKGFDQPPQLLVQDLHTIQRACAIGDIEAARKCILEGCSLEEVDVNNFCYQPLHIAVARGHLALVKVLVEEYNAPTNGITKCKYSPLYIACCGGFVDIALYLVRHKADLSFAQGEGGDTPLHAIAYFGVTSLLQAVMDLPRSILRVLNVQVVNRAGQNLLHIAATAPSLCMDMFSLLLRVGVSPNFRDSGGRSPLHYICRRHGSSTYLRKLIDANADISILDEEGWSPLMTAVATARDMELAVLLVESGGDVKQRFPNGNSCLHVACTSGNDELVRCLVRLGLDPAETNTAERASAIEICLSNGRKNLSVWLAGARAVEESAGARDDPVDDVNHYNATTEPFPAFALSGRIVI